ncbi:MAG: transcriptional regulator NrdR [Nitrospirota bacterium]
MRCPFCSHDETKVIDSRESKDGAEIRRRRECPSCEKRFTTYERVEELLPMVIKKDGRRETFDRQKILTGLKKACEKRPISIEDLENLTNAIEKELMESSQKEVPSSLIGEAVMKRLHTLDGVAYVRFASVYRQFEDISEFMKAVRSLLESKK